MEQFEGITAVKKANVYFDGKVTSRTIRFKDGTTKTLGYMLPGEYEFNTQAPEVMEILSGDCEVLLLSGGQWQKFGTGTSFNVAGNSKFKIKVANGLDYCCSFE